MAWMNDATGMRRPGPGPGCVQDAPRNSVHVARWQHVLQRKLAKSSSVMWEQHNKVMSILGNAKRVNFWYAILWARPREGGRAEESGWGKLHNWFLKDLGRKLEIGTIGERLLSFVFIKECGRHRAEEGERVWGGRELGEGVKGEECCIPTGALKAAWNSKGCTQMKLIFTSIQWLPRYLAHPHTHTHKHLHS